MMKIVRIIFLLALLGAAAMLWLVFNLPAGGVHLIVDDGEFHASDMAAWQAVIVLLAVGAVALLLPLVLLLAVGLPLLWLLGALLIAGVAVLGVGALALAPLLLPLWLAVWLWRRVRRKTGTTIAA